MGFWTDRVHHFCPLSCPLPPPPPQTLGAEAWCCRAQASPHYGSHVTPVVAHRADCMRFWTPA